jgi:hypothetical protein
VAHFPPVRPAMPGTAPDPVPGVRRTWLALLLGASAMVLLAGLVWGIITVTGAQPGDSSPAARATPAASPVLPGQQAQYEVTRVRVAARPRGIRVRWSPPSRTVDVIAFIVVAELGGRAQQEHTVGPPGSSALFAGLQAGRRYCFVVGTVVRSASGQQGTATAPPVCAVVR